MHYLIPNVFGGGDNPLIRVPLQGSGTSNNFTIISDDTKAPYTINGFYIDIYLQAGDNKWHKHIHDKVHFANGDTVTAALFNNEYNQLVNAFAYSSVVLVLQVTDTMVQQDRVETFILLVT